MFFGQEQALAKPNTSALGEAPGHLWVMEIFSCSSGMEAGRALEKATWLQNKIPRAAEPCHGRCCPPGTPLCPMACGLWLLHPRGVSDAAGAGADLLFPPPLAPSSGEQIMGCVKNWGDKACWHIPPQKRAPGATGEEAEVLRTRCAPGRGRSPG